ncbi:MAG: glycosyltransferase family 2 protein [Oscillospiraceae bacterium]|nr:glycosyltransferase family 2 protein [Oscillospiraceae bacterium]
MSPYFSIILPIYNVAPYLQRCVQSVLDQRFCDYELILVDDGSTDRSPEICDLLASQHQCIRVIHKENGGLSSARNEGTRIAQGDYIWWVDSDDWIAPDALQILYQASISKKPDMVKFNYIRIEQDTLLCLSSAQPGFYHGRREVQTLLNAGFFSAGQFCLSAWSHIYRRSFLEMNRLAFVSERIVGSEDYLFNLKALLVAENVQVLTEQLYFYEQRIGSLSQRYKQDLPKRYTQLYMQLRQYYSGAGMLEVYDKKICRFFVWHLLHGTCISNEYRVSSGHSMRDGRKNIYKFLGDPEIRSAMKRCDCTGLRWKQRVQLLAMRLRLEPVFYWLYVVKSGKKEERHYGKEI